MTISVELRANRLDSAVSIDARLSVLLAWSGVAWAQASGPGVDEPGMGIEFIDPDDATKRLVGEMVEKLAQDLTRAPA